MINLETRRVYMEKLDRTKNDDNAAYEFFRYCVTLDLTKFHVGEPPRIDFFEEQRIHNEPNGKTYFIVSVAMLEGNFVPKHKERSYTSFGQTGCSAKWANTDPNNR